ncbi:MAG: hypothetical protein JSU94_19115 [Phycisphaerales bacterium]|nr:MAG: hypothetical protein JSU94_19115 [Phycisphaerales bacterium]
MSRHQNIVLSMTLTLLAIANNCRSAGPEDSGDPATIIKRLTAGSNGRTPTVKSFEPEWVRSLARRDRPTLYTKENSSNFEYIGMPIGGIGAGQLYLGGDGKLWYWDIFNNKDRRHVRGVRTYTDPYERTDAANSACNNIQQGFAIQISSGDRTEARTLDREGFSDIQFSGRYPIGTVTYRDANCPLSVKLEAFSPFIPLDLARSTYPATVLNYTVVNNSEKPVTAKITGWLENAVCLDSRNRTHGRLRNRIVPGPGMVSLFCDAAESAVPPVEDEREDIIYEDFEDEKLDNWTIEGRAFSGAPRANYHHQPLRNYRGSGLADSFFNAGKKASAGDSDAPQGKMTSKPFTIERSMIEFLIGGGNHPGRTCLNLVIGGKVVRTAVGRNSETMNRDVFDVSAYTGSNARLEIVDAHSGGWGHIMVDQIVFTDKRTRQIDETPFDKRRDYGSMALALLKEPGANGVFADAAERSPNGVFPDGLRLSAEKPLDEEGKLIGSVGKSCTLKPGRKTTLRFILAWYFPNLYLAEFGDRCLGRSYGTRFTSALHVAQKVGSDYEILADKTRLWRDTWYDSTLPYWFLDRTFLNTSVLATNTCYVFRDGRFYGYEGVYCCPGTCTHVWAYAQAMARLFPELERRLRERVDYSPQVSFQPETGRIGYRGELNRSDAVDGHSGVILRTYREHQMSEDGAFLRRNYTAMKRAMDYLVDNYDADKDGILTGAQHNTLDAKWYGKITWLSLYYGAALRAAGRMADEMGDNEYARYVDKLADRGRRYIEAQLFNGEYFIQQPDPDHPQSPGVFNGCEYSQLLGQSWAYQVGLAAILDPDKVTTALDYIWRYNFSTDVGPFRKVFKNGRWYAMPGEGGLIACTWPHGGQEALMRGNRHFAGYLNECQNGYEYAATSLMMWHGMPCRALAHTRTLHDRYHAAKRNPWNEVECGDHYARSMASYGLFTAVCGFEYHGPNGYMAFSPRLSPENFKAAFTSAAGWGTFAQRIAPNTQTETLELKHGRLRLNSLGFDLPDAAACSAVAATAAGKRLKTEYSVNGRRLTVVPNSPVHIKQGQSITVEITLAGNVRRDS